MNRFPHLNQPDMERYPSVSQREEPQSTLADLHARLKRLEEENDRLLKETVGLRQHQIEREDIIRDLVRALVSMRLLHGLLPICSACKKIRDNTGGWNRIETYISKHSEAEFTHGLCPDCERALYPQFHKTETRDSH